MALFDNLQPEEIVYISSKKIAQELRHSEPEVKKPLDFTKISGIKKAAPELQKYIEDIDSNATSKDDIIIGGSSASFTQIKKFRVPKDLDITTPYLNKEVRNISLILRSKYGAQNVIVSPKFRANMGGKDIDVVQIKIKNEKGQLVDAADIKHEVDDGFMTVNVHPKIRIGKMYYEPLGYLIERKASAIKQSYLDKIKQGTLPRARAKKDIDDFRKMSKSVPDFQKKNLSLYMTAFEKNITRFDDIPAVDAPKQAIPSGGIIGGSDPFGASGFSMFGGGSSSSTTKKPARKNPLEAQGFKLW